MKRLTLAFFLAAAPLYADSVTSGSMGLLLPTTGVADVTRSWADKYNENFRIISSTTGTILTNLATIATDTTTINNRFNNVATDTTTIFDALNSTAVQLSNHITSANSTMTALSASTSTLLSLIKSTASNLAAPGVINTASNPMDWTKLKEVPSGFADGTDDGGAGGQSTFPVVLASGGDVFLATSPFIAINGMFGTFGFSTFNVTEVMAYQVGISTYRATKYQVWGGTSAETAAQYSPQIVISTNDHFSIPVSTTFPIYAHHAYSVKISTCQDRGGLFPNNFSVVLKGWLSP